MSTTPAPSPARDLSSLFDAAYFQTGLGLPYERNDHWLNFFGLIADEIIRSLRPRTVFDAGCALGFLVESLWDRGVETRGVDISEFAISQVRRDMQRFCQQGSLIESITGKYDLVTCIEVLEHLLPEQTEKAITNITSVSDVILFSSAPNDFVEPTHFNVRPVFNWLKLFAGCGFWPDSVFDASFLAPHAILFRRQEAQPEEMLYLFSEKIRLKSALIEREQRIGNLNAAIGQLKHQIGEAEGKAKLMEDQVRQYSSELERVSNENTQFTASYSLLQRENTRLLDQIKDVRVQYVRAVEQAERLAVEKRAERDELGRLAGDLQSLENANSALREMEAHLRYKLANTEGEKGWLQGELDHINRSAAWQFTKKYRRWIENHRNTLLVRLYERSSKWALRKSHINPQSLVDRSSSADFRLVAEPPPFTRIPDSPTTNTQPILAPQADLKPINSMPAESYESWYSRTEPSPDVLDLQREVSGNFRLQPLITVLVPVYNVPLEILRDMVDSVRAQTYQNWELCIAHGYPPDQQGRQYLTAASSEDNRIRPISLDVNRGISGNSNLALEAARGEFVGLLDHDDTLAPFALFEIVRAINEGPDVDLLYSDKDCIDESGKHRQRPLFKAKWSPDIMWGANYLTHFTVMRTELVRSVGGWRTETDGAQDWDIFLRLIDSGAKIEFVPGVLYHWRIIATSVSSGGLDAKPYAAAGQIRTINDHGKRRGVPISAVPDGHGPMRIRWEAAREHSVTVILVSSHGDSSSISSWADSVDRGTDWPNLEILASVPDSSRALGRTKFLSVDPKGSLANRLNQALCQCTGEYIVFLDQSVQFTDPAWLGEMVGPLTDPNIALVGAKLMDSSTGHLRHAGVVFNRDGILDYIFSSQPEWVSNEFGAAVWYRNWTAVSGACFAVKRSVIQKVGGFKDQPDYPRHDIDLCLRIGLEQGNRIIYNPFAKSIQTGSSLLEEWLAPDARDIAASYIRENLPGGDPFFHSQLESRGGQIIFAPRSTGVSKMDYSAESRILVQVFDASPSLIDASKELTARPGVNSVERLTWVLPVFQHAFYGGIMTILRFADYFRNAHSVKSDFVFLGAVPEEAMRARLASAFPKLAADAQITRLRSYGDWDRVAPSDATISTLWTTAYAALHFTQTRRRFYFIQDYESLFYPAGSSFALVEATYRFGYRGICNTRSLAETYREFGAEAEYFDPSVDASYFFKGARSKNDTAPYNIFCYARPGHARNCFELLTEALKLLKKRMSDRVRIFSAGAEWDPSDYGLENVIENLGLLGYSATGALYRSCEMGVVMMMTRHPSYLPMELMACGALVVTNENRYTRWLLENERNCLLSETSPAALAEVMERGLVERDLRSEITQRAASQIAAEYSDWENQTEKIYQFIRSQS